MISYGMFNSINGDRRYKAEDFAQYFATFIGNGIFIKPSDCLQVRASGDSMKVFVRPGKAWINGYYLINDEDYNLSLSVGDSTLNRIDRIVIRLDFLLRKMSVEVKKGALSALPIAPALQRDTDAYELALADIYIAKGTLTISQAVITDTRLNNSLCGLMHAVINQVDTTTIFDQFQAWYNTFTDDAKHNFDDWFETIKGILDSNVAGNLLNMIETHEEDYVKHPAVGSTTNVGNNYSTTIDPAPTSYVHGMGLVLTINAKSNGATTINVNGLGAKPILKGSGNTVKDLYAGGIYTLRYNQSALSGAGAFILQGEGGEYGTATAAQVLAGYTIGTDNGIFDGTIANRGSIGTVTPGTTNKNYSAGYYNAFSVLGDPDLIPANILSGKNIFNVIGSLQVKKYATGTHLRDGSNNITISGLAFTPSIIIVAISPPFSQFVALIVNTTNPYGIYFTGGNTIWHDGRTVTSTITSNGFSIEGGGISSGTNINWFALE